MAWGDLSKCCGQPVRLAGTVTLDSHAGTAWWECECCGERCVRRSSSDPCGSCRERQRGDGDAQVPPWPCFKGAHGEPCACACPEAES